MSSWHRSVGFTLPELLISMLLSAIVVAGLYSILYQFSQGRDKVDSLLSRVEITHDLILKNIDCDQTRANGACANPMEIYDREGTVTIASDGSTRIRNSPIIARCIDSSVFIQHQAASTGEWHNVFPYSLPVCKVAP